MGYWRPEYRRHKLEKLRPTQHRNLIVAVLSSFSVIKGNLRSCLNTPNVGPCVQPLPLGFPLSRE